MPKRESIESRIINYFREEELSKAGLMFGLVKGEMAKRQPKKRKTRAKSGPEVVDKQTYKPAEKNPT